MTLKLIFAAHTEDTDDIRGLCEQIGMCLEELGNIRLLSVTPVKGSEPIKSGRGPYKNVMLSDIGVAELESRFGKERVEARIADLSYKLYQKNYRYKDHFAAIVEWEEKDRGNPSTGFTRCEKPAPGSFNSEGRAASFDVEKFFNANLERTEREWQ